MAFRYPIKQKTGFSKQMFWNFADRNIVDMNPSFTCLFYKTVLAEHLDLFHSVVSC